MKTAGELLAAKLKGKSVTDEAIAKAIKHQLPAATSIVVNEYKLPDEDQED